MSKDKRPFYIWLAILIANTAIMLATGLHILIEGFWYAGFILPACGFLFSTTVPVFLSGLNTRYKHWLGFGFPITLFLPGIYFIHGIFICGPWFCDPGLLFFSIFIFLTAIIFAISYTIAVHVRKHKEKHALMLVWIVSILGATFVFIYSYYIVSVLDLYIESVSETVCYYLYRFTSCITPPFTPPFLSDV